MNKIKTINQTEIISEKLQSEIKLVPQWKIFLFVINNGAIGLSETGYKPSNSKISDFGKYELIITGNTPVVVIWKNSTLIYQKNKGTTDPNTKITTGQDQFYTKKYQVGDYWEAALVEDISGVDFSTLVSNSIYKTISTKRSYKLVLTTQALTVNDYLQFFVVFNDNNQNIGGDSVQDRQLLYLSEVVNSYDKDTGKFVAQTLTLSSLNDKLQSSGQTTLGFIQYASPGSGYAFPVVTNGTVSLNRDLMRDVGVTFAHRQSYGMELLSSCYYYGRPIIKGQKPTQIDNKEIFEQKVYAPRCLFIAGNNDFSTTDVKNNGGLFPGLNDAVSTNSHPETTFYNIMDAKPTGYQNFKDWKDWISSSIGVIPNSSIKKDFKGVLSYSHKNAVESNGTNIEDAKVFWDSLWNITNIKGIHNVAMSSYYKFNNVENKKLIGTPTFDYSKIKQQYMSSILNFNGTIFSHLLQMPYDSEQWVPFAFSNIPVIGKYLNELDLGIPFGFVLWQDSNIYQKMTQFNGFMSAFFANALSDIVGKDDMIPLNLFSNNTENEIGKLLGSNVSTTALLMKLTDRISIYPWDLDGKKLTTSEQISTVSLCQKSNDKIYIMAEDTQFLDINSPLTNKDTDCQWNPTPDGVAPGENYAYIIDYIVTQSLHQGEERHTFYSDNPIANNVNDFNELSVAQYRFNNNASFTGNMYNWTTQYKTNHDEYEETEQPNFSYPASIIPPDPENVVKEIVFDTNLNVTLDYKDVDLIKDDATGNHDNTAAWFNANNPVENYTILDIKPLLNPTLDIQNFEDLKKYYESVTVYYKFNIETVNGVNNNNSSNFNTTESFHPGTHLESSWPPIELKDLSFSDSLPNFNQSKDFDSNGNLYGGGGYAFFKTDSTKYPLLSYEFTLTETGNGHINETLSNNNAIGFDFIKNSDDYLSWKVSIFISPGKIDGEYNRTGLANAYAQRYTNVGSADITKIVLNPK